MKSEAVPAQAPEGCRWFRLPEFLGSRHVKVMVSPKNRSPLSLRKKFPLNPSGVGPATFRLVAQYFNQLRHRVPHSQDLHEMRTETVWPEVCHILQPLQGKCK